MSEKKSIIVLYGDMGLGNWIMLMPVLSELKTHLNADVYIIDFDRKTPFFYIENLKEVSKIIRVPIFSKNKWVTRLFQFFYLFFKFRFLSKSIYIYGRHTYSFKNLLLGAACGAKSSVANVMGDDPRYKLYSALGFNVRTYSSEEHEVENNFQLLELFNIVSKRELSFFFPKSDNLLLPSRVNDKPLVLIQALSSPNQYWKRWPESYWIRLIDSLAESSCVVILIGNEEERLGNQDIINKSHNKNILNLSGQISISELGFLSSIAKCAIAADSVLGHICSAYSTPVISLIGPGGNGRRPLGKNANSFVASCKCNSENTISLKALSRIEECGGNCMKLISPDHVLEMIMQIIYSKDDIKSKSHDYDPDVLVLSE